MRVQPASAAQPPQTHHNVDSSSSNNNSNTSNHNAAIAPTTGAPPLPRRTSAMAASEPATAADVASTSSAANASITPLGKRARVLNYNSDDERSSRSLNESQTARFIDRLHGLGFELRPTASDGNCLFRAVALQVYGDADMHDTVRQLCIKHMLAERDHYSQFVAEDFPAYIARKRRLGVHGNNVELQAIGELYNRPIQVYRDDAPDPVNLFHDEYAAANPPIRLAYHGACHYSALIDPRAPAVGVGLGLPGLEPGAADRAHLQTAIRDSEEHAVGEALVTAAINDSEAELIHDALMRSAMQESRKSAPEPLMYSDDLEEVLQRSRFEFFQQQLQQQQQQQSRAPLQSLGKRH